MQYLETEYQIEVEGVYFHYNLLSDERLIIFNNLFFKAKKGETIGLLGISGSGKSTFFKLLQGEEKKIKGKITVKGKIRQLYQFTKIVPYLTCKEILELEVYNSKSEFSSESLLKLGKLEEQENSLVKDLSEGQKQRLSLLTILASKADIILADEPFSRIDKKTTNEIREFIMTIIKKYNITFLMSTHNKDSLNNFDKIYNIQNHNLTKI